MEKDIESQRRLQLQSQSESVDRICSHLLVLIQRSADGDGCLERRSCQGGSRPIKPNDNYHIGTSMVFVNRNCLRILDARPPKIHISQNGTCHLVPMQNVHPKTRNKGRKWQSSKMLLHITPRLSTVIQTAYFVEQSEPSVYFRTVTKNQSSKEDGTHVRP